MNLTVLMVLLSFCQSEVYWKSFLFFMDAWLIHAQLCMAVFIHVNKRLRPRCFWFWFFFNVFFVPLQDDEDCFSACCVSDVWVKQVY